MHLCMQVAHKTDMIILIYFSMLSFNKADIILSKSTLSFKFFLICKSLQDGSQIMIRLHHYINSKAEVYSEQITQKEFNI